MKALIVSLRRVGCVLALLVARPGDAAPPCEPFVEEQSAWASARVRAHRDELTRCELDEATYRAVLGAWLAARAPGAGRLESIGLGRALSYPWISRHIADAALRLPGWPAAASRRGARERLAGQAIRDPALLRRLAAPFEGTPLEVQGVAFEKVLFGPARVHASDPAAGGLAVPYDAQLWLRLAPRR